MFRIISGAMQFLSHECPTRVGVDGKAHLRIAQDAGTFDVAAVIDGKSATVNGIEVWDAEKNDWGIYEYDDVPCGWEEYAAEESADEPAPASQGAIDEATAKLAEASDRLDDLQAENAKLAEHNAKQAEALIAADVRVTALEDQVVDLEKALDEATQPEAAPEADEKKASAD